MRCLLYATSADFNGLRVLGRNQGVRWLADNKLDIFNDVLTSIRSTNGKSEFDDVYIRFSVSRSYVCQYVGRVASMPLGKRQFVGRVTAQPPGKRAFWAGVEKNSTLFVLEGITALNRKNTVHRARYAL